MRCVLCEASHDCANDYDSFFLFGGEGVNSCSLWCAHTCIRAARGGSVWPVQVVARARFRRVPRAVRCGGKVRASRTMDQKAAMALWEDMGQGPHPW
jgi:hypothetical protein